MPSAPLPENETERLGALRSYHILDTLEDKDFDELTELASAICQTPIALISLVDKDRQWFKSRKGLTVSETEREYSFCAHAITRPNELLIVEDPKQDPRFSDNPLVTGPLNINFYAGVPLVDEDGFALGSLCVIDQEKRHLTDQQINALRIISWQVIDKLKSRKQNAELKAANEKLVDAQQKVNLLNAILIDSENRWKTFTDQSPVATAVFRGPELTIEVANGPMLELLGKTADIIGKPLLKAIPELQGQPAYEMLADIYRTGKPVYGYGTAVKLVRNGVEETGYYDFTYTPIIENNQVTGIIDMAVNVTEQVLARLKTDDLNNELLLANTELAESNRELAQANSDLKNSRSNSEHLYNQLKEAEATQRVTVEAARIGIWEIDPNTKALKYNNVLADIFGYEGSSHMTYDEAISQVTDSYRDTINKEIERAIKDGGNYDITYQQRRFNDGEIIWLRSIGRITKDGHGEYSIFTGVVMDVTAQMQAQQNTIESEERFRIMAEGTDVMIAVGDETGNATYFNKAWSDFTGRSIEQLLLFGWVDLMHPDDQPAVLEIFTKAFKETKSWKWEFRMPDMSGEYRWLLARGTPRFRSDGSFAGL